jgi:GNAT superfamily N-acetyltransferase
MGPVLIRVVTPAEHDSLVPGLVDVLRDCVADGASLGFIEPPEPIAAATWWARTLAVANGLTWVAIDDDGVPVGCVQLQLPWQQNGRHRAEIAKLMVHRRARGLGVGGRLLAAAEDEAERLGRRLLMLNTRTGDRAERMCVRHGWQVLGVVPDFAAGTDGRLYPTTFMTKALAS